MKQKGVSRKLLRVSKGCVTGWRGYNVVYIERVFTCAVIMRNNTLSKDRHFLLTMIVSTARTVM